MRRDASTVAEKSDYRLGDQVVTRDPSSPVYVARDYSSLGTVVPVDPRSLSRAHLYEGRVGVVNSKGKIVSVESEHVGFATSVEALLAHVGGLGDNHRMVIRPVRKKGAKE
jgi:hypothetical protein